MNRSSFNVPIDLPNDAPGPRSHPLGLWVGITVGFLVVGIVAFSWTVKNEHSNAQNVDAVDQSQSETHK